MTIVDELKSLSAAEDFFRFLGIDFDSAVVNVARLHILKRMGQYLRQAHDDADENATRERFRDYLERAYQDFVKSTPIEQRVFKVHQDAVRPAGESFLPLSALTIQNGER